MTPLQACGTLRLTEKDRSALTLYDTMVIEALEPETREIVERYAKLGGRDGLVAMEGDESYKKGWADAMEAAEDEVHGLSFPSTPPSRKYR
jgi:hypothetical protein